MRITVFSTKYYEREYLNNYNKENRHQLTFFKIALNIQTMHLVTAFDAVCIQLTNIIDTAVISQMSKSGIKLIALRSVGYDKVDIKVGTGKIGAVFCKICWVLGVK